MRYSSGIPSCTGANVAKGAAVKASTLERLKSKLLEMRKRLVNEVDSIKKNSLSRRDTACGDISAMPIHMADIGSDNYDKEFALDLIEGEQEELREIDAALERLADGSFGRCELCGERIAYGRLSALPFATLCIECKRREEAEGG